MFSILYISYDGILVPLGQSQVLVYPRRVADGRRIPLISFGKSENWARVEHPFRVIKPQFGHFKVRYRNLKKKNTHQLMTLFNLSNLWMVHRKLMATQE